MFRELAEIAVSEGLSEVSKLPDVIAPKSEVASLPDVFKINEIVETKYKNCPIEGHNGHWEGVAGNSRWIPDKNYIPAKTNADNFKFGKIMEKFEITGIDFREGEPDFSNIAKDIVNVDDVTDQRTDNFQLADEIVAKSWGCTPKEVVAWRTENQYTWHECRDMQTMQMVPRVIHNNIPHRGGVSLAKEFNRDLNEVI